MSEPLIQETDPHITKLAIEAWMQVKDGKKIRDRTTSKIIEKHQGKLTQQSNGPLQGNDMATLVATKKITHETTNFNSI